MCPYKQYRFSDGWKCIEALCGWCFSNVANLKLF